RRRHALRPLGHARLPRARGPRRALGPEAGGRGAARRGPARHRPAGDGRLRSRAAAAPGPAPRRRLDRGADRLRPGLRPAPLAPGCGHSGGPGTDGTFFSVKGVECSGLTLSPSQIAEPVTVSVSATATCRSFTSDLAGNVAVATSEGNVWQTFAADGRALGSFVGPDDAVSPQASGFEGLVYQSFQTQRPTPFLVVWL